MEEMVEIYRKYIPQVYKFLFSLCHDAHLSEELTQETKDRTIVIENGKLVDEKIK